jgi:regulator of sigma E protease
MSDIVGSIWWMIVALGVLVTFHEFGHYWVAKRCGVKVLRFSVGFGKPLWSRRDRHGTEFAIAAIPLGGYVKMLDEAEGDVPASELPQAFNRKPVLQRIAIVAAGPIANLVLCVALLWAMFVIGRQDYSATVGQAHGLAAKAGFVAGDRIQAVDGQTINTWGDALQALTTAAMDRHDPQIVVSDRMGVQHTRNLSLSHLPLGFDQENVAGLAGFAWQHQLAPALVEKTQPGSPASKILIAGDRITAVDGDPVRSFGDISPLVQKLGARGGTAMIEVERNGERLALDIRPAWWRDPDSGKEYWTLGIAPPAQLQPAAYDAKQQFGPLAAIPAAFRETRPGCVQGNRQAGFRLAGHDSPHADRTGLHQEHLRPHHHRPGGQCDSQTRRRLVPVFPGFAVAQSGDYQPDAYPGLGRRTPAVLPYRVGQRQSA